MGLPRAKNTMPTPTLYGRPVEKNWYDLDPAFRKNALEELQFSEQMEDLADKQAQRERERQSNELEAAAIADLEAGADIGNVFRQRPGLALSRNFNQFANMAQMVQPSKAASTLAPSLARSLNPQSREKFLGLIQTPAFANDPLGAMTQVQMDEEREKQHGELVKAGIPLSKIDRKKTYSPIEFEEMILQNKKSQTGDDFTDKLVQQAWSGFDENYIPPEGVDDPIQIAIDMADKKNSIREQILSKYGKVAIPQAATTISSALNPQIQSPPSVPNPKADVESEIRARLANVPVDELPQAIESERVKLGEAEQINKAWQGAKNDLESKLKKIIPDKDIGFGVNPLEQFAMQVIGNKEKIVGGPPPSMLVGGIGSAPMPQKQLVQDSVLKQLGLNKNQKVFREPGEKRKSFFGLLGTQDVTYDELIKDWAEKFLKNRNLIPKSLNEDIALKPSDPAKIENVMNQILDDTQKP